MTGACRTHVNFTCAGLISECGGGRSPVFGGGSWVRDENTGKLIDRNNHSIKALGYFLSLRFGYAIRDRMKDSLYGKLLVPSRRGRLRVRS